MKQNKTQRDANRAAHRKLAVNLSGIDRPWYEAYKAAYHATPEQHAAAAEALAKRDVWDEIPRRKVAV